jgi:hypothetical protein
MQVVIHQLQRHHRQIRFLQNLGGGVNGQKLLRADAQAVFQADNVIGRQNNVDAPTAMGEAFNLWVALEFEPAFQPQLNRFDFGHLIGFFHGRFSFLQRVGAFIQKPGTLVNYARLGSKIHKAGFQNGRTQDAGFLRKNRKPLTLSPLKFKHIRLVLLTNVLNLFVKKALKRKFRIAFPLLTFSAQNWCEF